VEASGDLDAASVSRRLTKAGCIAADDEADELIKAASGDTALLEELVARRTTGEPIAWLTGEVVFCDIRLFVAPGVYVPRWQTEPMARRAAELVPQRGVAVDLCTGAGAIAAVLSATVRSARVVATEIDEVAARCARQNGVEVLSGFLDDPLPSKLRKTVDVLTAVVPYVPTGEFHLLPRDVQRFEPRLALDGGPDGTDLLAEVARRSTKWLRLGGWLLLEVGGSQADWIGPELLKLGFGVFEVMADDDGDVRAVCAQLAS